MDIVCYAAEMKLYSKCLQYDEVNVDMNLGKVSKIETGEVKDGQQKLTAREEEAVKDYSRYRDDTQGILVVENENLLREVLKKMCSIYPTKLVYNVILSHRTTSHPDVCYYLKSSGRGMMLFPRKSIDSPVGFGPALSNMSDNHRSDFILGEYIRYERIANDKMVVDRYMKMLFKEMVSVGYDQKSLVRKLANLLRMRETRNESLTRIHLGVTCQYDGLDNTHQVLMQLLRREVSAEQDLVDNIMPVPGRKLKGYMMNRKIFLNKMRNSLSDLNKISK